MNAIAKIEQSSTIRYDDMCNAIAAAYQVDEVKHIRDKAMAIEVYARQAKNVEAERQACEIRLRAERRCGQLLAEREKAKGGQPKNPSHHASTSPEPIADLGISHTQSSRWQKLAEVPESFADWLSMRDFWRETHPSNSVFSGVLIRWIAFKAARAEGGMAV